MDPKEANFEARESIVSDEQAAPDIETPREILDAQKRAEQNGSSDERVALEEDKFTTQAEAEAKAKQIGCAGFHTMTDDGETVYMPCDTHAAYEEIVGSSDYRVESKPAPKKDQIEGSKKNKPGSAKGPGGNIKLSDQVQTSLRNKVKDHNEKMKEDGRPSWTKTTYGQLAAVYRRGAGAYSTSHRPGVSRAAWAMARVNAYLYLLRNGKPENAKYITDNDLLPPDHPKSTRGYSYGKKKKKKDEKEDRAVDLSPPAFMRAAARQGLKYVSEGKAGGGLTEKTIREARAMAAGNVTADKWMRLRAWIARHMPDLDAPAADPSSEKYPSPGVVAHLLWGSGPSKRGAERTMKYAERVIGKLEKESMDRGENVRTVETRRTPLDEMEIRENADGMFFEGYAAVFDSPSKPLPFTERIAPGAFIRSLKSRNDIKLLWNHDSSEVLGSTRAGTMKLVEDDKGLKVTAQLPNTTTGRDAAELLKRGDVDAMSFGFTVARGGDDWSEDGSERTLREVMLHEVSIVAFPAYEETAGQATVRGLEKVAERAAVDLDALSDALIKLEMGEEMTEEDTQLLTEVLDSIAPEKPEEEPENVEDDKGKVMLELKKQKLKLLEAING